MCFTLHHHTAVQQSLAHSPLSCWQQVGLLAGSWLCTTPLLDFGASEFRGGGSITCSVSAASSLSLMGSDWGKPNMRTAEQKSKAPHRRKPAHQAPIHRGSSGVMPSLPVERHSRIKYSTCTKKHIKRWWNIKLTGVDEDGVHVELSAKGAEDEATGRPEDQSRKEDSCTETNINFNIKTLKNKSAYLITTDMNIILYCRSSTKSWDAWYDALNIFWMTPWIPRGKQTDPLCHV